MLAFDMFDNFRQHNNNMSVYSKIKMLLNVLYIRYINVPYMNICMAQNTIILTVRVLKLSKYNIKSYQ